MTAERPKNEAPFSDPLPQSRFWCRTFPSVAATTHDKWEGVVILGHATLSGVRHADGLRCYACAIALARRVVQVDIAAELAKLHDRPNGDPADGGEGAGGSRQDPERG